MIALYLFKILSYQSFLSDGQRWLRVRTEKIRNYSQVDHCKIRSDVWAHNHWWTADILIQIRIWEENLDPRTWHNSELHCWMVTYLTRQINSMNYTLECTLNCTLTLSSTNFTLKCLDKVVQLVALHKPTRKHRGMPLSSYEMQVCGSWTHCQTSKVTLKSSLWVWTLGWTYKIMSISVEFAFMFNTSH